MLRLLGSQFSVILLLIIGGIAIYAINSMRKEKMSDKDTQSTLIGFGGIGFIIMIICFVLYECSHTN